MSTVLKISTAILVLVFAGGAIFLMNWDMPPPSKKVEKILPNDRLLR